MPRLVLFLLLLLPLRAHALGDLTRPWPDPDHLPPVRSAEIRFPGTSPYTPAEAGQPDAPRATVVANLYMPRDRAPDRTLPAVVMLHGAGGMIQQRGDLYGKQLAAQDVAVLVIDTFGSRPERGTSFNQRVLNITETMFVADAYAGLQYLASLPEIDPHRVVLAGFSYGGMATMYALHAQLADRLAPAGLRFAGHVAFYGPCIARFEDPRTTGAPLLMLYGEDDQIIDPRRCAETADELRRGGSAVTVIHYPGAVHQWDGALPRRMIGRNLAPCDFTVDRFGIIHDTQSGVAMTGWLSRRVLLFACVSSNPYPIGRDDRIRAESNRDLGRFLMQVFRTERAEFTPGTVPNAGRSQR